MPRHKLTPQQEKLLAVFKKLDLHTEATGCTAANFMVFAKQEDDSLFPLGVPIHGAAAALMTGLYRKIKGLHRVKADSGHGYKYFYNPEIDLVKNAPRRSPKKKVVQTIGDIARKSAADGMRLAKAIRPESTKYQIVKKTNGDFAGVVRDGVLFESLESFVAALNA